MSLAAAHTYADIGADTVTVTVNAAGHAAITGTERVAVQPTAQFTVSPQIPDVGKLAMLFPDIQSPNGSPITEFDWNFGDGTPTFRDTPAVEMRWAALLANPGSQSSPTFITAALRLGIDVTLGGQLAPAIGASMWSALLNHGVPHIFAQPHGYRVTLTLVTTTGPVTGSQDIATQTSCNLWANGIFGNYTVCDTVKGWQTVTSRPDRWPDYYTFQIGDAGEYKGLAVGANVAVTIASTGDVYVSYGGTLGLGVSFGHNEGSHSQALGVGFVEAPNGPKPSPDVITNYVDGWNITAAVTLTAGHYGGGVQITWSPGSGLGGEEYYLTTANGGATLSLTTGASCAVHVGSVNLTTLASLASLVPTATGPWPWQDGATTPVITPSQVAAVLSISPPSSDLATCGLGAPALTS